MIVDEDIAGGFVEARAVTIRTSLAVEELGELLAHGTRLGLAVAAIQVRQHTLKAMRFSYLHAARVGVEEVDLFLAAAVEDDLLQFFR